MPEITRSDTWVKNEQNTLPAVLLQYLHLKAPDSARPTFEQVVGFKKRTQPIKEYALLHPAVVPLPLGRRQLHGMPTDRGGSFSAEQVIDEI